MKNFIRIPNCYLCNSETNILYRFKNNYSVIRCNNCQLLRTFPLPEENEIKKLYRGRLNSVEKFNGEVFKSKILEKIKDKLFITPMLEKFYEQSGKNGEINPKLLDIGCSTGWITSRARDLGFNVKGMEYNQDSIKVAREKYNLDIIDCMLEDLDTDEKYNSVLMMHVLEHFSDPLSALIKVNEILFNHGNLLVVVPNTESLTAQLFKSYYPWNVPRHLTFFTKRSIYTMLNETGFEIIEKKNLISPPLVLYSLNRLLNDKTGIKIKNPFLGLALSAPISFFGKLLFKPDVIAIYARKAN